MARVAEHCRWRRQCRPAPNGAGNFHVFEGNKRVHEMSAPAFAAD
jgi:hypothetical protein